MDTMPLTVFKTAPANRAGLSSKWLTPDSNRDTSRNASLGRACLPIPPVSHGGATVTVLCVDQPTGLPLLPL